MLDIDDPKPHKKTTEGYRLLVGIGGQFNADDTKRRKSSAAAWPPMASEKPNEKQEDAASLCRDESTCSNQAGCTEASGEIGHGTS